MSTFTENQYLIMKKLLLSLALISAACFTSKSQSLDFDGMDDHIVIPTSTGINGRFAANTITVEGWYYIRAENFGAPMLIGESYLGDGTIKFCVYQDGETIRGGFHDFGWHQTDGVPVVYNTWQHIACTYDQTSINLYINGTLVATLAYSNPLPTGTEEWRIGARWDGANYFDGQMDEVRVWNIARTQSQIQNSMGCVLTGTEPGLVAYYDFSEGVPNADNTALTAVTDVTANSIDGTLNNFALNGSSSNWIPNADLSDVSVTIRVDHPTIPSGSTDPITATAYPVNGGDAATYQWLLNGVPVMGETNAVFTSAPSTFLNNQLSCILTSNATCISTNNVDTSNVITVSNWGNAQSLSFDGNNDFVSIPYAVPVTETTFEFWFKTSDPNSGLFSVVQPGGGNDRDIYLTSGNINVYMWDGGPTETISSTGINYADGNWHHLAHVMGASVGGQKLYMDGVLVASGSYATSGFNWNTHVFVGYGAGRFLNGQIDELHIWEVTRTQSQIQNSMGCSFGTPQAGLIADYDFNQGVANADNSGVDTLINGAADSLHGTLINFTALNNSISNWTDDANASNVAVTIRVNPSTVPAGSNDPVTATAVAVNGGDAPSYQWLLNGVPVNGETNAVFTSNSNTFLNNQLSCILTSNATCVAPDNVDTSNVVTVSNWGTAQSLAFDGIDDYVSIPFAVPFTETTYEFWFKTSDPDAALFSVVQFMDHDRDLYLSSGNINAYIVDNSNTETISSTGMNYADNTWHHLAYVIGASIGGQKVYVDGVEVASGSFTTSGNQSTNYVFLGFSPEADNVYLRGQLDELHTWNVALTQAEIQSHMNCKYTSGVNNLGLNLDFDEGVANADNYGVDTLGLYPFSPFLAAGTLFNFALNGPVSNWTDGVSSDPIPTLSLSGNMQVCAGSVNVLTANGTASSYTWSASAGSATTSSVSVSPTDTTTYTVMVSNGACQLVLTDSITLNTLENPVVTANAAIVCANDSTTLTANVTGGTAPYNYEWDNSDETQSIIAGDGTYTVIVSDDNGCSDTTTVSVTTYPALDVTTTLSGITITSNEATATYQWLDCDNVYALIPAATNQSFTAAANGNYAVSVSLNGCPDTSACVNINSVGISQIDQGSSFTVFPNPANGIVNIKFNGTNREVLNISLENALGQTVYTSEVQQADQTIDVHAFQGGVYSVKVRSANGISTKLIIIE
jgi:hypothetical protein